MVAVGVGWWWMLGGVGGVFVVVFWWWWWWVVVVVQMVGALGLCCGLVFTALPRSRRLRGEVTEVRVAEWTRTRASQMERLAVLDLPGENLHGSW